MSEQFPLTSAEDLRARFNHLKTKPVHPQFFSQGVIESIQLEAIRHGIALGADVAVTHKLASGADQTARGFYDAILTAAKEFKL